MGQSPKGLCRLFYTSYFHGFATSGGNTKTYEVEVFTNTTADESLEGKRKWAAQDLGVISGGGIMYLDVGDVVSVALINLTDTTSITFEHLNLTIHKLGG